MTTGEYMMFSDWLIQTREMSSFMPSIRQIATVLTLRPGGEMERFDRSVDRCSRRFNRFGLRGVSMLLQAEISLYPLREEDLTTVIYDFVEDLKKTGLKVLPGATSTLISGQSDQVFSAVQQAYLTSASKGQRVMVVKYVNPADRSG